MGPKQPRHPKQPLGPKTAHRSSAAPRSQAASKFQAAHRSQAAFRSQAAKGPKQLLGKFLYFRLSLEATGAKTTELDSSSFCAFCSLWKQQGETPQSLIKFLCFRSFGNQHAQKSIVLKTQNLIHHCCLGASHSSFCAVGSLWNVQKSILLDPSVLSLSLPVFGSLFGSN